MKRLLRYAVNHYNLLIHVHIIHLELQIHETISQMKCSGMIMSSLPVIRLKCMIHRNQMENAGSVNFSNLVSPAQQASHQGKFLH